MPSPSREPTKEEVEYSKLGATTEPKKRRVCNRKLACVVTMFSILGFFGAIFLAFGIGSACCFPIHASCSVDWSVTGKCTEIEQLLISQINKWQTADNCKEGGQKCLYKLVNQTTNQILATHETPKKHYIDDLTFTFTQSDQSCQILGKSSSQLFYAVLDKGTNYCNLHNLITGAGVDKLQDYTEVTSNKQCTQYSSADCEVY